MDDEYNFGDNWAGCSFSRRDFLRGFGAGALVGKSGSLRLKDVEELGDSSLELTLEEIEYANWLFSPEKVDCGRMSCDEIFDIKVAYRADVEYREKLRKDLGYNEFEWAVLQGKKVSPKVRGLERGFVRFFSFLKS